MKQLLFIAIGGSFGAVTRYLVSKGVSMLSANIFPYGTLTVNIAGAFLIGFLFSMFNDVVIPVHYKSMITVGFLGAFTTFSTYSLESVNLLLGGEYKVAAYNIIMNNLFSIAAVFGGIILYRFINNFGS